MAALRGGKAEQSRVELRGFFAISGGFVDAGTDKYIYFKCLEFVFGEIFQYKIEMML